MNGTQAVRVFKDAVTGIRAASERQFERFDRFVVRIDAQLGPSK